MQCFTYYIEDLIVIFATLQRFNIRVNPTKRVFFWCQYWKFLGHLLTSFGIDLNLNKVKVILALPNMKEIQQFI
ncbi:hypothetical protein KSP40_PGU012092 [Platanthera guangdongensis]|uniref:Reverse transcriptase domain-containing protein n=1 Tax=Platanthera guangdongensis TaxID=2320717 RepID=A0ABR2ML17_9ASPA